MSKSALLRTVTLVLGVLLCLASIPASFAQEELTEEVAGEANNSTHDKTVIHDISPNYYDMYMQQGESSTFTVIFKNNDKKTLEIEPKIVAVPYSNNDFNESWISISPENVTVDPGEEQEFTVEVSIPEDANGGYYETYIVFTDDKYSEDDMNYINVLDLYISVPAYQKLELQTYYISDSVEAGNEYEYTVKIKNVASKTISINPEINSYDYSFNEFALDDEDIEITAPSTLEPGEIAEMVIRVPVPENATGTYDGYIEMNVDENENNGEYEPQLELYLNVIKQPTVPYVKTFSTKNADPITIEISTYDNNANGWLRSPPKDTVPSFELKAKYNSSPVDLTLIKTTQRNSVYIGWDYFPTWSIEDDEIYQNSGNYYTETYTIPGAIGDWELEILPENTEYFDYSIIIGDSE